jgi:demethylspheroidene O-methyltransferase
VDTARQETAPPRRAGFNWRGWRNRLIARPGFQRWAARTPAPRFVRAEGQALFDLVSGFVYSQVLAHWSSSTCWPRCATFPARPGSFRRAAHRAGPDGDAPAGRCGAGAAGAVSDGRFQTSRKGAALLGVPGLPQMIRHHAVFYRDMADPLALLRGEAETELAQFWPYVFGARGEVPADYRRDLFRSDGRQPGLVAEDTLRQVDPARQPPPAGHRWRNGGVSGRGRGGTSVAQDDPVRPAAVAPAAAARFAAAGLQQRGSRSTPAAFAPIRCPRAPMRSA